MFLVTRFYQTASVFRILHKFCVKLECRKAPSRSEINRAVNKFEMAWSVSNKKAGIISNKYQNTMNVHRVEQVFLMQSPGNL